MNSCPDCEGSDRARDAAGPSGSPLFEVTAAPYVVLDTDLCIQGVNPAYLRATGRSRDGLTGVFMFDAFPDNPEDADATGVLNLGSSLERVLRHAAPHDMGVQRYDIPRTDAPGAFRRKTWSPVNSPLSDIGGRIVGVLHHVEDITVVDDILHHVRGADPPDVTLRPAAVLRRAMLAAARYERAFTGDRRRRDHHARFRPVAAAPRRHVPAGTARGGGPVGHRRGAVADRVRDRRARPHGLHGPGRPRLALLRRRRARHRRFGGLRVPAPNRRRDPRHPHPLRRSSERPPGGAARRRADVHRHGHRRAARLSAVHGISTHETGLWLRAAASATGRPLAAFVREIMARHGHRPDGSY